MAAGRPGYFDRFRRRVIFPIISEGGRVLGFGGRIIVSEEVRGGGCARSQIHYELTRVPHLQQGPDPLRAERGQGFIREKGNALIVEGYMDLLSLCQAGFRNVVASLGTALTSSQLGLLGRYAEEAFLVFDGDESGQKATQRSLELFLQGGDFRPVVSLPGGYDPDSFIRKEKGDNFERDPGRCLAPGGVPVRAGPAPASGRFDRGKGADRPGADPGPQPISRTPWSGTSISNGSPCAWA